MRNSSGYADKVTLSMTRRTLLKLVALLPLVGPGIAKALANPGFKPARVFVPFLPAEFPKWNRKIDGLENAGLWALEIERSRLPHSIKFPRVGEVWEAMRDCGVSFGACISFQSPPANSAVGQKGVAPVFSPALFPFGNAQLKRGEKVRILEIDGPPPICVTFQPVRYQELENSIVPDDMRHAPGYHGYTLSAKTVKTIADLASGNRARQTWFTEAFMLVQGVTPQPTSGADQYCVR